MPIVILWKCSYFKYLNEDGSIYQIRMSSQLATGTHLQIYQQKVRPLCSDKKVRPLCFDKKSVQYALTKKSDHKIPYTYTQ